MGHAQTAEHTKRAEREKRCTVSRAARWLKQHAACGVRSLRPYLPLTLSPKPLTLNQAGTEMDDEDRAEPADRGATPPRFL